MPKFRFFPHTADAKFRAYGKTIEEQFANAAVAMTSIMFKPSAIEPKVKKQIVLKAPELKSLLVDWLNEFLFLLDTEFFILREVKSIKITKNQECRLEAEVVGDAFQEKYERHGHVKAATYQEMELTPEYVQVVVDV